jgi:hypothetical protein
MYGMDRETHQPIRRILAAACTLLAASCLNGMADIVYFDEGYAHQIEVIQQTPQAGSTTENIYLSTEGINSISGELQFSITATRTVAGGSGRTKRLSASIGLSGGGTGGGIGNMLVSEGDLISQNTDFNLLGDPLLDLNLNDNKFDTASETFSGYVPIKFAIEGTTSFIYGWVEIEATIDLINGPADEMDISQALITVKSMAFETNWDDPIAVGAVPEPSVLILVLITGIGTLAGRHIFPNIRNRDTTA